MYNTNGRSLRRSAAALATLAALCGHGVLHAQVQQAKLLASNPTTDEFYGDSVALSGDTAVVGTPYDDEAVALGGAAYVYVRSGATWALQAVLTASDAAFNDNFGDAVAIDSDTVVVGASNDGHLLSTGGSGAAGSAYVFVRSGSTWTEQAKLTASNSGSSDQFGLSVAIDGDTVVVGAWGHDDPVAGIDAGAAYVYARSGSSWTEQAVLTAIDGAAGDLFGGSVSVSGDTAFVGSDRDDHAGLFSGSAYVFGRRGTLWSQDTILTATTPAPGDRFGSAVAVSGDWAAIGAWGDDDAGIDAGAVHVFVRATAAPPGLLPPGLITPGAWAPVTILTASDATGFGRLGAAVAIEGSVVVAGAPNDDAPAPDSGSAYVYDGSGATWTERVKLTALDGATLDHFGQAIALSGDGILVASIGYDDPVAGADVGAAYVFARGAGPGATPRDVTLLDLDGDGDLDAATAHAGTDDLGLYGNDGSGTLGAPAFVALTAGDSGPAALAAGDLDGDGDADDLAVACADSHTVAIVFDPNALPVVTSLASGGRRPAAIAVGDLDGIAPDDVVVGREGEPLGGGPGIAVSLGGAPFVDVSAVAAVAVAVCDLDGDGNRDVAALTHGSPDQIVLLAGDGLGGLTAAGALDLPTSGLAQGLCCDDLDGDANADLVVALPVLFPAPGNDLRVYVYADNGSGALDPADYTANPDVPTGGTFASDIACGELEDDGIPGFLSRREVVVVHAGSGDVEIHHGFDGAVFTSTSVPTVGTNPFAAAVGDLNGDGGDDVVIANAGSGDVTALLTTTPALAQPYGAGCAGTGGLIPQLGGLGVPTSGSTTFGLQLSDAHAFAPALLLFGGHIADGALAGGCRQFVATPATTLIRFTDGTGADTFVFGVPSSPALLGLDAFFQYGVFDPAGAFAGVLALSNGLRIQIGT